MPSIHKSLGKKIKQARLRAHLSQKTLGKSLKLSDKAVSSYEVDRSEPSLAVLKQISQVTRMPFDYFIQADKDKEIELQAKLKQVEAELKEIKQLLQRREKKAELTRK